MSFRVGSVEDLQAVWRKVKDEPGVTDMRGMDHGNAWSFYFRDPEGNRIEIFCDTQWYIEQPCLEDLDLSLPADEIRAKSDAFCRTAKGFRPIAEFQAEVAKKIARGPDPVLALKAIKNSTEIKGARAAHLRDGVACAAGICNLPDQPPSGTKLGKTKDLVGIDGEVDGDLR